MTNTNLLEEATVLYNQNNIVGAISALERHVLDCPDDFQALSNLSFLYYTSTDFGKALTAAKASIAINPNNDGSRVNYGNALLAQNHYEEAFNEYRNATEIDPYSSDAWSALNLCCLKQGKMADAIKYGLECIRLNPNYDKGLNNLALAYQQVGDAQSAHEIFTLANRIHPQKAYLLSNLLMNLQYLASISSAENLHYANRYQFMHQIPKNETGQAIIKRSQTQKRGVLNLGFVSADFYSHPIGFFFKSVIAELSRLNVVITLFKNQDRVDDITLEIESHANHCESILRKSDSEVSELIKAREIDVLFDMSGHTSGNRLGVFALKPCPLQITWLGYFASTGVKEIDYVLMSKRQVKLHSQAFFTEKLLLHDASQFVYSPPDYSPDISYKEKNTNDEWVFGCFNNIAKLNACVIETWATILKRVANSRLVLKWKSLQDLSCQQHILRQFTYYGIAARRIEFRAASPHKDMLAQYNDIDIALDPFPFSGALSSCEALWMGRPVVSLYGERPVSRQTFAILSLLGLSDFCAQSPEQYIQTVQAICENRKGPSNFQRSIRARMLASELMQPKRQAKAIFDICTRLA